MTLTFWHLMGMAVTLFLVTVVGVYAGRKVKSSEDFTTSGKKATSPVVAGTIIGTLVSGAATVGTAQLAFQYGLSAWWFTLGSGIAFVILGLTMVGRIYNSDVTTIPQFLTNTYGSAIGPVSSVFASLGLMISMIAQTLSLVALITAMFPLDSFTAASIGALLVLAYVLFGGVWGTGLIGVVKLTLLYIAMIACGTTAYFMFGGFGNMAAALPAVPYFSLFGRGVATDAAAGFSLIVGVFSTQVYFQAIMSGKSLKQTRIGVFASAALVPPLGLGAVMVGLFMRANFPEMPSSEVLPLFIINYLPPVLAGVVLATLLITVVGGWAGMTLGISTLVTKDLYEKLFRPQASSAEKLKVQRVLIILICMVSVFVASGNIGSMILAWSFMSMGLRGCTVFFPLLGAMFCSRFVTAQGGFAAVVLGPLVNFVWKLTFPQGMDSLYPGLAVSFAALVLVSYLTRGKNSAALR